MLAKVREVLIGFDSAWTDNPKNPGAIAAYVLQAGQCVAVHLPRLATFDDARRLIGEWTFGADYVLIAVDQPTIVPNHDSCRPVDRVAGSLIGKLGGGVQPARRGGKGAIMFGDEAPIWAFLDSVGADQNPTLAREATVGKFLIEVFPALALPAIVPDIWLRGKAAKYNPASGKKFVLSDWIMVALGVEAFTRALGAGSLADWVLKQAVCEEPRKADQDKLDAAICLAIALAWRRGPRESTLLLGDERTGYMATIVSAATRSVLAKGAGKREVAVDAVWS